MRHFIKKRLKGKQKYRFYLFASGLFILFLIGLNIFILPATTFSKSSFELMEGLGGWQIYDPFKRTHGYTGDIYTTDEQSYHGNYSLKFKVPTSFDYEIENGLYVSTVALVLFFANPIGGENEIVYQYEIDGEQYSEVFSTLPSILKDDLIINPNIEFFVYAIDEIQIRVDLTAWDYDGKAIGRNIPALTTIDPQNNWISFKRNVIESVTDEVGPHWLALRSIEIRLFDERGILVPSYKSNPCEIYLDDFKFYSGDPDEIIDYENMESYDIPISMEFVLIGIVVVVFSRKKKYMEEKIDD